MRLNSVEQKFGELPSQGFMSENSYNVNSMSLTQLRLKCNYL